ncbi:MAG: pilin [Candidatus Campbellbacteria bacterium]|nr:pilin [Candidatus Campbellbacteria bacterium]
MANFLKSFLILSLVLGMFLPTDSLFAQETIEPVGSTEVEKKDFTLVPEACTGEDAATECGFDDFLQLIANIMGFLLVFSLSLATVFFAWAGFRYATAAGDTSQTEAAKKIFTNVAIGLVLVFGAYLLVQVIVSALGVETNFNQFLEDYGG